MTESEQAEDALSRLNETRERLLVEIHKGIIGQDEVIEQLLITLLARGHCLLTGNTRIGKDLARQNLVQMPELEFQAHSIYAGLDACRRRRAPRWWTKIRVPENALSVFAPGPIFRQRGAGR